VRWSSLLVVAGFAAASSSVLAQRMLPNGDSGAVTTARDGGAPPDAADGDARADGASAIDGAVIRRGDSAANDGSSPAASASVERREAVLVFGGDLVPHLEVHRSLAAKGGASLFAPIVAALRAADVAMLNFETPAAPSRSIPTSQMQFNVHEDFVRAVAEAGIDAVSVANNHGYDQGVDGVGETVRTLRAASIVPLGGALADEDPLTPARISVLGEGLCVLSATRLLNFEMNVPAAGRPRLALAREAIVPEREAFIAAIRAARASASCAAIMVSLHSGTEYTDRPDARDQTFFRRCADAGADVVIGHHPHTPHPVERYRVAGSQREVTIFYSLGNFLSNQGAAAEAGIDPDEGRTHNINFDVRTREGLLAVLRFTRPAEGRLVISRAGWVPLWTINSPLRRRAGEAQTIQAALMPWEGGDDPLLRARWQSLVRRVGEQTLLARADVPASVEAYAASEAAVFASRAEARQPARTRDRLRARPQGTNGFDAR
jgi:poly-gamma-glutamate synthesis protein (capsule biosynthesis protein)